MAEPAWGTFAGVAALVTVALVGLARLSAGAVDGGEAAGTAADGPADGTGGAPADGTIHEDGVPVAGADEDAVRERPSTGDASMSPGTLLANVVLSQGLFGSLLVVGAWYAAIPPASLGLGPDAVTAAAVGLGAGLGVVLYAGDELLAAVASRAGVDYSEALRELLAPASRTGWLVLLGVALPTIAAFEELLFRGVLVGALAAGFDVSPWLLAVGSSVLFGFAHGVQGRVGVAVTGALGFALAVAFVVTGSLLVVIAAHYVVNALEFVVHEGLDVEWTGR